MTIKDYLDKLGPAGESNLTEAERVLLEHQLELTLMRGRRQAERALKLVASMERRLAAQKNGKRR